MNPDQRLRVRPLTLDDLPAVQRIQAACFPGLDPWTQAQLAAHLARFPEGQIGVELDGRLVATSSSVIVDGGEYEARHDFRLASGNYRLDNHDPEGDTLYGIDIAVDPEFRGLRLARRLYDARKQLARGLNLRRMFIAGRMPQYRQHAASMSPEAYVQAVRHKRLRDSVLYAQMANGFTIRGVLRGYLPKDQESKGNAVLMEWLNPEWTPDERARHRTVRVAVVQYQMRPIESFDEFATQVAFFAETAADYRSDFIVYPELVTNQLLALVPAERPALNARRLDEFTTRYVQLFSDLALRCAVNIVGGTHLTIEDGQLYNVGYLFLRDGGVCRQRKLHITPAEARWWGVAPGDRLQVFDTDRGKVCLFVCYDIEFPELGRIARGQGADVFFVPYNTDIRSGHLRVRSCAQARAIENHVYCVLSGAVGNLPFVEGADIHYAQSCVLTPSDIAFARDGVATEATPNVETMLIHDLDLEALRRTRRSGTVRTWMDRRTDLYRVTWKPDDDLSV